MSPPKRRLVFAQLAFFMLVMAQCQCCQQCRPTEDPIGLIIPEVSIVQHGSRDNPLRQIDESRDLFEGDQVSVREGGESVLDFGAGGRVRLFNDTDLGLVRGVAEEGQPPDIEMSLEEGSLTGVVTREDAQVVVETPNGAEITVLGTEFAVAYDSSQALTVAVNFGGVVWVDAQGSTVTLPDGYATRVFSGQPPVPPFPFPVSRVQFETSIRAAGTPSRVVTLVEEPGYITFGYVYNPAVEEALTAAAGQIFDTTSITVELVGLDSREQLIEGLCSGAINAGIQDALSYVRTSAAGCAEAALNQVFFGEHFYRSQIIASAEYEYTSLQDLHGAAFCIPDYASTSGWVIPDMMLRRAGIDPQINLYYIEEVGGHESVIYKVYEGSCQAGATFAGALTYPSYNIPDDVRKLVVILEESPDIPNDAIVFAPDVPPNVREKVTDTFLEMMADPAYQELFREQMGWEALVASEEWYYEGLRALMAEAGVLE